MDEGNKGFGFGARDEDVGVNGKLTAVEFFMPGEVS